MLDGSRSRRRSPGDPSFRPIEAATMTENKRSFFGETYQIQTDLSPTQISEILDREIESMRLFRLKAFDGDFGGTHDSSSFRVSRIIRSRYYRNFAPPRVEGTIRQSGNGSTIGIKISRQIRGLVFLAVWVVAWTITLILAAAGQIEGTGIGLPLAALFGGLAFDSLVFWAEVRMAKTLLDRMFQIKERSKV